MIDRLVYINQMLNENLHYMYSINSVKFYEITSNDLESFREELEILKILRKHLKNQELHFMEDTPRIMQWLEENENDR